VRPALVAIALAGLGLAAIDARADGPERVAAAEPRIAPELVARDEHTVWRLGPNRLLAHRIADGDLVIDAGSAGFARYTRFDMPAPRWSLGQRIDGERAARAGRRAALELPLTADQAASARTLIARVHADQATALTVELNGRPAGRAAEVALAPGWQTIAIRLGKRRLIAGENRLVLDPDTRAEVAVGWLRLAAGGERRARRARADRRGDVAYDSVADALLLRGGAGLAWYVLVPDGAQLVAAVAGDDCRVDVTARAGDGAVARGRLDGDRARVDLAAVAGRVVRLELVARDCPLAYVAGARVTAPGPEAPPLLDGPPPRYVVLWVMDALRGDRVRPFQPDARPEVPNFEALAATGVVFRQYYVQGNESQTSHASVWTSTYPAVHDVRSAGEGGTWRLRRRLDVLGRAVADAGLAPIAVTANGFVNSKSGYARGFAEYRNLMRERGVRNFAIPGATVLGAALERLDAHRDQPTFLFLGTIDTHSPWVAHQPWIDRYDPEPYDGPHQQRSAPGALGIRRGVMGCSKVPETRDLARLNAIYDSSVSYQDARLGDLVAALRRWGIEDQTMIIVTADHGEEWFEDGRCGHGGSLRDTLLRVPLLVHYPARFPGGVVVDEGAEGVDLLPTILDALGAPPIDQAQGAPLRALAAGRGRGWVRPSYASQYEYAHAMRLGAWKIVVGRRGAPRVIDLAADPLERTDLAGERPVERRFLTDALSLFLHYRQVWKKRSWGVVTNLEPEAAIDLERIADRPPKEDQP